MGRPQSNNQLCQIETPLQSFSFPIIFNMPVISSTNINLSLTMTKIQIILLLALFSLTVADVFSKRDKDKTIITSDHFYSEDRSEAVFEINNVVIGKPLLLILKKKHTSKYDIKKNPISVSFNGNNDKITCEFTDQNDHCVIPKVVSNEISMNIGCAATPCEVSWIIYQPEITTIQSNQLAQGLFTLQKSNDHMVATITCNDPQIKTFEEDVNVYSDGHYERGGSKNEIYFLFANEEKGFMYIDIKEKSRQCAHLSIANIPHKIPYSGNQIRDFTNKDSTSEFKLDLPTKDVRIDCLLHRLNSEADHIKSITNISLFAIPKDGKNKLISRQTIQPIYNEKEILFSIVFKKVEGTYEALLLKVESNLAEMTIVNFVIDEYESNEVELGEKNYFDLSAGEKIKYQLLPEADADQSDTVYFIVESNDKIKLSSDNCSTKTGCSFEIEALKNVKDHIYFSSTPKAENKIEQIEFLPINKTIKRKVRDNVNIYLKKQVRANKAIQVMVNSPNVLIYASSKEKCNVPTEDCYERTGNYHHPFVYVPKDDGLFLFNIEGLDSGEFTLTILDEEDEFIPLEDGLSFSYTMDETEDKVLFKYKLKQKIDVSFNLIAPLNNLLLRVANTKQIEDDTECKSSSDGYIIFSAVEQENLEFSIEIKKTALSEKKITHFTLIASTNETAIKLEDTVTHYQTLKSAASREYVFEFDPKEEHIVNFYLHNYKQENISIMLSFSNNRIWNDKNLEKLWIDKESDSLDLKYVSELLCKKEGAESCEIFMRLENQMSDEIDLAITLMVRNSVIELKDGIWQSYAENSVASSASFYFYPKHYDRSVALLYSSMHSDLRLIYNLWKTDSKSINPVEWPFPDPPSGNDDYPVRPINHIFIDKDILRYKCEPNCVILITLYRKGDVTASKIVQNGYFRILAYNNQVELPENTRISMALKNSEEKQVMIDLKYLIDKQIITFFTTHTIGNYYVIGNVYSENNPRCPELGEIPDFQLQNGETEVRMDFLKSRIVDESLGSDVNLYICLTVVPQEDSKLSIQYSASSSKNTIKKIHMDTFQEIQLEKDEKKLYQIDGFVDFYAKIIRKKGYPYVIVKKCDASKLKECKEQILASEDKGKQLVGKTEQFEESPCQNCIYLFKFESEDPSSIVFHLQSKYSQIELKQHEIISDFIGDHEESRYQITNINGEDLIVNIHVQQGDVEARLTDTQDFKLIKSSSQNSKLIHFFIPGKHFNEEKGNKTELGEAMTNSFTMSSTFSTFHLILNNKNMNKSSTYTITYSSGENKIFLQDGLITDITLQSKTTSTFYYSNEAVSQHIYLTLSMANSIQLTALQIKCYYLEDGEQGNKTEFIVERPPMKKKTPNPTLLLSLPSKTYFEIELSTPSPKPQPLSIGINHQQVIFLPFSHEYPFAMHARQELNFLVQVGEPGYIQVNIRKCDESDPIFSYAYDYHSFIKEEYNSEIVLNDDPTFEYFIKIKKAGTFYINFKSTPYENSLLSINLQFLKFKPTKQEIKAGKHGILDYEIIDNKKASIQFTPLICNQGKCTNPVTYYTMSAQKIEDLYSQLVCPSNFFSSVQLTSSVSLNLTSIPFKPEDKTISFTYELLDHISFLGVKAVTASGEQIYYRPIEIITFWGQLSRTSKTHKITIASIIGVTIISLLLFVRHNARRGYRPIQQAPSSD